MAGPRADDDRTAAARAALDRVERETAGLFETALASVGRRAAARKAGRDSLDCDPVEIWGRRIGRVIGWVVALLLAANLVRHWFF